MTHVSFTDRKTAEAFYASVKDKKIQGVDGEVELSWVANTAGPLPNSTVKNINVDTNGEENDGPLDSEMVDASKGVDQNSSNNNGGGERGGSGQQEAKEAAGDLDYDVAGENEWDMA